jgi:hypothetical protein
VGSPRSPNLSCTLDIVFAILQGHSMSLTSAEFAELLRMRAELRSIRDEVSQRRLEDARCRLAYELAAFRLKGVLRSYFGKAGFNPNQPRVSAGSSDGGQWTGIAPSGSDDWEISASRRRLGSRPHGHHYIPHGYYGRLPLQEETRKVFDEAKTRRLRSHRHIGGKEHDIYTEAVTEKFEAFMKRNRLAPEQMTPAQARSFTSEVLRSKDPRIRDFNLGIWRRELIFNLRQRGRRPE